MQRDILLENKGLHDVNPLLCGEECCEPLHSFGPFVRQYYLLHYVCSGKGVYHVREERFEVGEGQIFVIFPHEVTTYIADSQNPWHYCWIGFESSLDLSKALPSYVLTVPECAHIFNAFLDSGYIVSNREWYICSKLYELLSLLSTQSHSGQNRALQYVRMAQNYIEMNYHQRELRVEKLAENLNLDRSYFSKIFRRYTGKPPQRYIVDFRLDKATELIARRGFAPGEAAQRVGYGDVFIFSRMFRKRFGMPPSAYQGHVKRLEN